jgi:serine/threonine protein kinase
LAQRVVMELVPDAHKLRQAIVPTTRPARVLSLLLQALYGLREVSEADAEHAATHRDLSPNNLLVANDGKGLLKIADFGFAKQEDPATDTLTGTGQHIGTPGFIPPEQLADPRSVDVRSDIWTVGRAFTAAMQQRTGDMIEVANLPEPFRTAIGGMTRYDRDDRIETPSACIRHLLRAAKEQHLVPSEMRYHARLIDQDEAWDDWKATFVEFCSGELNREHLDVLMSLEYVESLAQEVGAGELLNRLDNGPVAEEFGTGGAAFNRCDRLSDLYQRLYPLLERRDKNRLVRRLFGVAADYHRYHVMYALRAIYLSEADDDVGGQLIGTHQSDPRFSIVAFPDQ